MHLYHIYIMLLKMDVFFFLGFDIQFLLLILKDQSQQAIILHCLVSFPGTLILAYYAVKTSYGKFLKQTMEILMRLNDNIFA